MMDLFYRIPIYLGYILAGIGLFEAVTNFDFMGLNLNQGIATAALGLVLSMSYLYFWKSNRLEKALKEIAVLREKPKC
jgi:hypothetical protein